MYLEKWFGWDESFILYPSLASDFWLASCPGVRSAELLGLHHHAKLSSNFCLTKMFQQNLALNLLNCIVHYSYLSESQR